MHCHIQCASDPKGSVQACNPAVEHGRSLAELAAETGISLRCALRWHGWFRPGGPTALADRRSVRLTQRLTLDPQ